MTGAACHFTSPLSLGPRTIPESAASEAPGHLRLQTILSKKTQKEP